MRVALATLVIATVALVPTADAGTRKPCQRKGSTTVASTKHVRVFKVPGSNGGDKLYGCLRSNGRQQLLAESYDDGYVTSGSFAKVKVAGRFVAWQFTAIDNSCKAACPPDYNPTMVHLSVRDLRKRKTVHVDGEVVKDGRLVLTTGGALAWTQGSSQGVAVRAFDASGARTLDDGAIAPGSLRLQGSTVSWTNAGEQRSATLAPRV